MEGGTGGQVGGENNSSFQPLMMALKTCLSVNPPWILFPYRSGTRLPILAPSCETGCSRWTLHSQKGQSQSGE